MKKQYSIVSKAAGRHGKNALVSFASKPMWKEFEELRRQEHTPGFWDKETAQYAIKKYGNEKTHEIIPYEQAVKELEQYKKDFPAWQ